MEAPEHLKDAALRAKILRGLKTLDTVFRHEVPREADGHALEAWFVECRRSIRVIALDVDQLWRPESKREAVDLLFHPREGAGDLQGRGVSAPGDLGDSRVDPAPPEVE